MTYKSHLDLGTLDWLTFILKWCESNLQSLLHEDTRSHNNNMHASVQCTARLAQLHGLSRVNAVCCFDSECPSEKLSHKIISHASHRHSNVITSLLWCIPEHDARRRRPQHQFHPGINVVAFVCREPVSGSEQRSFLLEESQWLCKLAIEEDHKEELNCRNLCFPRFPAVFFYA